MKKFIAIVLTVSALFAMFALSAAAATKQDVLNTAKNAAPAMYSKQSVKLENAMNKLDLTAEQCDALVALMNETKGKVNLVKDQMHDYTAEEQAILMDAFAKGCEICGLTYTSTPSANPVHANDTIITVYKDGKVFDTIDGEIINETMVASTAAVDSTVMVALTVVTALVAVFGFAYSRKFN